MLRGSGRLYIPRESDFIPRLFRDPDRSVTRRRAAAILHRLQAEKRYPWFWREWRGPTLEADELCPGSWCTPGEFVDRLFTVYAQRHGAERWGDKKPIYAGYLPLLHRLLPEARFVHTVRDGRDAAMSMVEKWGAEEWHTDLMFALKSWQRRVGRAKRDGAVLGADRFTQVRYEDLVADPELELRRLCSLFGEPFSPSMVSPQRLAAGEVWTSDVLHRRLHQAPNAAHARRWVREMPARDRVLAARTVGETLRAFGYDPAPRCGARLDRARWLALSAKLVGTRGVRDPAVAPRLLPPNGSRGFHSRDKFRWRLYLGRMTAVLSHLPGTVHVAPGTHQTYDAIAAAMEAEAIHAVQHRGAFHLALSGGSTPEQLYVNLVADPRYRGFPWRDTHLWQVDERRVPRDDERSNFQMLRETLTVHADIPEAQVHPMPVLDDDPAKTHEAEMARTFGIEGGGSPPRLDFVLLGMGGDLHTASLFPHSKAIGVNDRWIAINDGPEVTPPDRVTMTYPLLNAARRLAVLLTGEKKADPLQRLDAAFAHGTPDVRAMPIAGIAPRHDDGRLDWHLDPTAAGR